ncbi:MAG: hypothetical protein JWN78_1656, partial [Bacteroidota bacterium]|nr:hypothetical protein [Bacteroidota bacterium]
PQLITIIKEKKSQSISMFTVGILIAGLALWIAYGFKRNDLILIISNTFSLIVNVLIVIFTIKYRTKK